MPKPLKYLMLTFLGLVLLFCAAIAGLIIFIDPNDYKDEISAKAREATGRQLTITGDINYSLFPWIGISLGKTELSNAEGFGDKPFASVDQIDIKVSVLPLFQQRLEMQKVRLNGLQAFLAKDKNGRNNWDDLVTPSPSTGMAGAKKPPVEKPEIQQATEPTKAAGAIAMLAIDGLELKDAHIEWDDQQGGQHVTIDKLTLLTGPLALPAPVDVSLSLNLQTSQPKIQEHVEFKGLVIAKLDEHIIDLKQLQLNVLGMALTGQFGIKQLDTTPQASGQIQLATFSPRSLASKLGIELPDTSDSTVLNKASANMEFTADALEAKLNKLSLQLDDSEITGTASVKNFSTPVIRFSLNANEFNVDRYLPPQSKTTSASSAPVTPGSAATAATQLPLEPLRALDIDGNLSLGKLTVIGAHLETMKLGIRGKNGEINLHPVQASLYNGQYDGNIRLDVRTETPKVSVNEKLTMVNVGPLLKDVMGKELLSGSANIAAQLTATGHEVDSIRNTLSGNANFSFHDGKVNGVNIGQMIREAYAKLKKKPAPPKTENATDFAEMTGSMTITNGVVRNNDLSAKSPLLRIKGEGKVDLPRERIDYHVNAAIVESNEGQTGKELEELKSLLIPIKVTGKLFDPRFTLDLGPVLQKRTKEVIDTKIEKEKKKIKKKLEEDLKKKLGIKF